MKTMLRGAVAAIAILAVATPAMAAHQTNNERHYASPGPIPYTITNPGVLGIIAGEAGVLAGVGTRYTASTNSPDNTETATPTVNVAFTLTGSVTKDCSFYSGNNASARNIDFGVIGVRTGNNENVGDAFEMVSPATANINSLTAGCNFNNTVSLVKANGSQGMVNSAAGGYDSSQFQANLPYQVAASWTGTTNQSGPSVGSVQNLNVATTAANGSLNQGAWRSAFNINITAPTPANALVAGTYSDTLTLTLQAL
jgi:hypothetical protein